MIRRLRKRFIRIATLAVTAVLLVLCLSVNIANYISVDSGLTNVLNVISDNRGTMPPMPHGQPPEGRPDGQFTKETPFSTRYFVLRYDGDGDLIKADLDKIASVTEADTASPESAGSLTLRRHRMPVSSAMQRTHPSGTLSSKATGWC